MDEWLWQLEARFMKHWKIYLTQAHTESPVVAETLRVIFQSVVALLGLAQEDAALREAEAAARAVGAVARRGSSLPPVLQHVEA
mgnify:CR=1 FL=1